MTVAKPICATCLAIALAAPSSALASPAGSEYLPQVPKSSKDDSDRSPSGGSSSTESSSVAPTVTDTTPSYPASSGGGEPPAKKQRPAKEKEDPKDKPAPVKLAPVSADTAGSSELLPVALLIGLGGVILFAGAVLRRQYARRLTDPAR